MSTVSKSVIATTRMRTVRTIHQEVDVTLAVLHNLRDPPVKVMRYFSSNVVSTNN